METRLGVGGSKCYPWDPFQGIQVELQPNWFPPSAVIFSINQSSAMGQYTDDV